MSGSLDELRGRMLARRKRSRLRSTAIGSLALVAAAFGMGSAAVLLWRQAGTLELVSGPAASYVKADWQSLFRLRTTQD